MLRLTERDVRGWADEQGFADLSLAELDYRLVQALSVVYQDDFLAERLLMKGGTAINKLYLGETSRLSVDLDFNHVGGKEQVLKERRNVREKITSLLRKQDDSYVIHSKRSYEQTTVKVRYKTVVGAAQRFKLEISHIERFPILKPVRRQLATSNDLLSVATYQLEELTATKLRALFERLKGRDVYDLFFISKLKLNPVITRKMFLYYFYRSKKVYNPLTHFKNLSNRYVSERYVDDVSGFTMPTVEFSLKNAAEQVLSYYSFLNELDDCDNEFLALACWLLGRQVAKERLLRIKRIDKPLEYLFEGLDVSDEAKEISTDEIMLFKRKKQQGR